MFKKLFFFKGFTIFSVLGNLANELNVPIETVIKSGQGLAFISYPTAIAKFDYVPQVAKHFILNFLCRTTSHRTNFTTPWFFIGVKGFLSRFYNHFNFWFTNEWDYLTGPLAHWFHFMLVLLMRFRIYLAWYPRLNGVESTS